MVAFDRGDITSLPDRGDRLQLLPRGDDIVFDVCDRNDLSRGEGANFIIRADLLLLFDMLYFVHMMCTLSIYCSMTLYSASNNIIAVVN